MQKALALKCGIIIGIGLVLLIPLVMISSKISERRQFLYEAQARVAQSWTGEQTLISPIIVQPYQVEVVKYHQEGNNRVPRLELEWRHYYIIPDSLGIDANLDTEVRHQGIYNIPVYFSKFTINGALSQAELESALASITGRDNYRALGKAFLAVSIADSRGIDGEPTLTWQGQGLAFLPNANIPGIESGLHSALPELSQSESITFSMALELRGMQSLRFVPAAKQVAVNLQSTWPHPQFSGAFLPQTHSISAQGFTAEWRLNQFSTGISQLLRNCENNNCYSLYDVGFGVNFIHAVDSYLQAERSLKYGMLFIGLSFIAFFIFETLRRIAIHPVQYTLVGVALSVFFLLLTSLSEHVSFALSYFVATLACVGLLAYYLRYVLGAWKNASLFSLCLTVLYGVLYVIVGAEDYALLMGSVLIFVVLAGIMIMTRKIDWYQINKVEA